ncbi:response regulator [Deinococcus lacus]|uniref:histidine kinase n=1 Tax=Deinococcus lacus TaxID=392561 RepID=A0ABW1YE81_9DEIO
MQEHVDALNEQLDAEQPDIAVMFRASHTIKGSSYMVGLQPLGDFAHRMEDLLGAVRDGAQVLDGPVLETLERSTELLGQMMAVASGQDLAITPAANLLSTRLRLLAQGRSWQSILDAEQVIPVERRSVPIAGAAAAPERTTVRVDTRQLDELMEQIGGLVVARARVAQAIERLEGLQSALDASQERFQRTVRDFEERYLNPDMVSLGNEAEAQTPVAGADLEQQFDELEFDTYNDLNILARSITELSADFSEVRSRFAGALGELQEENEELAKLTRRLRQEVSRTSRVPFSQATTRLRRWARERRDRFDLHFSGEETEIENAILQRLGEPLLHLLTNAVNHGLGDMEARVASGKPARGNVWIRVNEVGSFLEVSVQDDGRGLNMEAIRTKALERGLRSAQELDQMPDQDIARLILLPGLTTMREVNAEAGRGVGMDVVATIVRQLGGDLLIRSEPGQGTTFTLRIPTTQRIADLLLARVGTNTVSFAVNSIRTLREVNFEELRPAEGGYELFFEGRWLPVVDLRRIWGIEEESQTWRFAILAALTGDIAVRVDEFGTIEEVAISPLGTLLGQLEYLSGTTISPSGEPLPILDPAGLSRLARRREAWLQGASRRQERLSNRSHVLLVDDSLSVRRLVSRMLERGGYEVSTANDGQEALDMIQLGNDYDLVISDLEMPRMNGYELLSAIRGRPASASLPLVVMTTRAGEKHQRLAFQLGANDYFSKPVDEALLLRRLNSILASETA